MPYRIISNRYVDWVWYGIIFYHSYHIISMELNRFWLYHIRIPSYRIVSQHGTSPPLKWIIKSLAYCNLYFYCQSQTKPLIRGSQTYKFLTRNYSLVTQKLSLKKWKRPFKCQTGLNLLFSKIILDFSEIFVFQEVYKFHASTLTAMTFSTLSSVVMTPITYSIIW